MTTNDIELSELSIDELEAQRAVLLPPREELGKKKNRKKNSSFIDIDIKDSFNDNRVLTNFLL